LRQLQQASVFSLERFDPFSELIVLVVELIEPAIALILGFLVALVEFDLESAIEGVQPKVSL
jgi:hypothetical protein